MRMLTVAETIEAASFEVEFNRSCMLRTTVGHEEFGCTDPDGCNGIHDEWFIRIQEANPHQEHVAEMSQDMVAGHLPEEVRAEAMAEFLERSSPSILLGGSIEQIAWIAASLTRAVSEHNAELYARAMDQVIAYERET